MNLSNMRQGGRGVTGMFLALVLCVPLSVASARGQGASQDAEAVFARQKTEIEGLQQRISSGEKALTKGTALLAAEKELAAVKRECQNREANIKSLKNDITSSNNSIAAITREFEVYKDQYRAVVRGNAKGRSIAHLETRKGVAYENVTIREVTPIGLLIRHDGGLGRIPFEELPDAMQDEFQFDPDQKAAAVAKESELKKDPEPAAPALDAAATARAAQKKAEAVAQKVQTQRAIEDKQAQLKAMYQEISRLEDSLAQVQRQRRAHERAPAMKKDIAVKKQDYAELRAQIKQLQDGQ